MKRLISFCILQCAFCISFAQSSSHQYVTVVAEPDHADWTYHVGETPHFTAYAICENVRMADTEITYSYGPDKLDPVATRTVRTDRNGMAHFTIPAPKQPGFTSVRVEVTLDGRTYKSMTNIACDPYSIQPTTTMPRKFQRPSAWATGWPSNSPTRPPNCP